MNFWYLLNSEIIVLWDSDNRTHDILNHYDKGDHLHHYTKPENSKLQFYFNWTYGPHVIPTYSEVKIYDFQIVSCT